MKHLKFKSVIVVMLVSFLGFTACKNDKKQTKENASSEQVDQQSEEQTSSPEATSEEDTDQSASSEDKNIAELTIDGSDKMQYDKKELKVKAGQTVQLTLTHSGSMPKSAMGHNFVLLKNGVDPADFAKAAWKAKDNDYIPSDKADDIIAHTKVIGGGEETTITFKAPEKGTYDFLCTFPGHYANMHGKFIVE